MRTHRLPSLAILVMLLACEGGGQDPAAVEVAAVDVAYSASPDHPHNAVAPLSGAEEVPPVVTRARGAAKFQLSADGTAITYQVNVANIVDVLQSHIHMAPAGVSGPIVVWLYPAGPPAQLIPGRSDGPLATGTITAANLMGPLAGGTIADLWNAIREGRTYVNVHTDANRPGEIRGQLNASGN